VIYGASFEEVREKLDRLKGNSADGVLVPDQATTLGEYLDYWLREVVGQKWATTARGPRTPIAVTRPSWQPSGAFGTEIDQTAR
jgi:hypothetical protein